MLFLSFSSFTLFPYHQASLLLPPSTTSSAVAPPLVPTFPPKQQDRRGTNQAARPHRQPAPDCRTAPRAHSVQECSNVHGTLPCVRVCACVRACRLDSSTIVHRTAHPEVAPRCRTGRRESCIPVTGCLLAPHCPPPTPGGGHLGAPNFLGSFFLESMEMAAQRSDSPQAQVETNGGRLSCPNWSQLETPTLTGKTRNEECLIQFKPSSKRHSF